MRAINATPGFELPIPPEQTLDPPAFVAISADLESLVLAHSALLFRVAYSILHSRPEAEDAVQDVFLRVLKEPSRLAAIRDPRVWLVRIVWNLALDRRRRIRPNQMDDRFAARLAATAPLADRLLAASTHTSAVFRQIDRLPASERQAILLAAQQELTTAEIASILNRTESATRALLHRARTRLRQRLEKKGPS